MCIARAGLTGHAKSLKGNNDLLCLSRPDIVTQVHEAYLDAGSDLIETNTFSGTTIAQADYALEHLVDEINTKAAVLARQAADKFTQQTGRVGRGQCSCSYGVWLQAVNVMCVAHWVPPIGHCPYHHQWNNRSCATSVRLFAFTCSNDDYDDDAAFDELVTAYKQQTLALLNNGVDIILIETIFDTANAKAAIYAVRSLFEDDNVLEVPVFMSGTIVDKSGRTLSGQTAEAFLISIKHSRAMWYMLSPYPKYSIHTV